MLVHGDDFVLLADDGEIKAVGQLLKSMYTVKVGGCDWRWKFATRSCYFEQDRAVCAAELNKQDGHGN